MRWVNSTRGIHNLHRYKIPSYNLSIVFKTKLVSYWLIPDGKIARTNLHLVQVCSTKYWWGRAFPLTQEHNGSVIMSKEMWYIPKNTCWVCDGLCVTLIPEHSKQSMDQALEQSRKGNEENLSGALKSEAFHIILQFATFSNSSPAPLPRQIREHPQNQCSRDLGCSP